MMFKRKMDLKRDRDNRNKQHTQDIMSAQYFMKGLRKGQLRVGSIMFSGDDNELKIIKKICRYLGYTYVSKEGILCENSMGKFYVAHYNVK